MYLFTHNKQPDTDRFNK